MKGSAVAGVLAFVGFVTAGLLGAVAYMQFDKFRKEKMRLQEESRKREDALKKENIALTSKLDVVRQRLRQVRVELSKLKGEKEALEQELETHKQIVKSLREREKRYQKNEEELRAAKSELDLLKKQLLEKENRLAALQRKAEEQSKELSVLRKAAQKYDALRKQVEKLNGLLKQKNAETETLQRRVKWLQNELSKAQAGQFDTLDELKAQLEEQRKTAQSLYQKCSKLAKERDSLKAQLEEVASELAARKKAEARLARKFVTEFHFLGAGRGSFGTLRFRCSGSSASGTIVSLSQVLNPDPSVFAAYAEIRALGRFGFSLDLFETSYTLPATMTEDVTFFDMTLESGHRVEGEVEGRWGTVALYLNFGSPLRSGYRRFDIGVSAGGRFADYYVRLRDTDDDEEEEISLTTGCPFVGLWFRYYIATDICFGARVAGGTFKYGDYTCPYFFEGAALVDIKLGSILSFEAGYIFTIQRFRHHNPDEEEDSRFEQTSGGPYAGVLLVF